MRKLSCSEEVKIEVKAMLMISKKENATFFISQDFDQGWSDIISISSIQLRKATRLINQIQKGRKQFIIGFH
jgi:hypothetical protein